MIADIRDRKKMDKIFKRFKPEVVFHAAAYKHVPMMEYHPDEAISSNITGTKNVGELANKYGCKWQVEMHLVRKTILHLLERKKWLNPPLLF